MNLDHFAKQVRRRGVLAAMVGLLAAPMTARAQTTTCAARGAGCTLFVPCCGDLTCVQTSLYNPNVGVCRDQDDDDDDDDDDDGGWFSGPDTDDDDDADLPWLNPLSR